MARSKIVTFVLAAAGLSIPAAARAHFVLQAPPNWAQQDSQGLPLKSAPCGQADPPPTPAAVPTNVITPFAPGDTVTITINETVPHPGHYRVVLSPTGPSGLPADPAVTGNTQSPCGTTTIQNPAVYPVLADGMLQHTGVMSGARSFTVKLPTDVTCTKCSLQVQEFMSNHALNNPGGCWYHHCADISIQTGTGGAAGRGGAGGAGGRGGAGGAAGGAGAMAGRGGAGGRGGAAGTTGIAGAGGSGGTAGVSGTAGSGGATGVGGTGGAAVTGAAGTGGSTATGSGGDSGTGGSAVGGATGGSGTGGSGTGGSGTGGSGAGGTSAPGGTGGSGVDAGPVEGGGSDAGCGCVVGASGLSLPALVSMLIAFVARRQRRRR